LPRVELRGLRKQFGGGVVALDCLDLDVASGEFVSLLGPSGCGKTTALRIVAGFETPDEGQVLVDGVDVLSLPASRRNMGMVFQSYSLFPNMTAKANVAYPLRIRRRPKAERESRATDLLGLVGLARQADRYPHQLSGGQQQRVALARALAHEPAVLLLDEPLSALDAKVRVQLREEVRRIQLELGITTVYVTHDQEEALSISDRVAVLSEGRAEQVGTPAEIYNRPRTPFVASFVGTVNQIEAVVASAAKGTVRCGDRVMAVDGDISGRPEGSEVAVYLRPEDVGLVADETPGRDASPGKVRSLTFLGPVTRVGLDCGLGQLVADVSSDIALHLAIGDPVAVVVEPGRLRTLAGT
jgi:putative spermidine/putrescine transport system ATP-binding protein